MNEFRDLVLSIFFFLLVHYSSVHRSSLAIAILDEATHRHDVCQYDWAISIERNIPYYSNIVIIEMEFSDKFI